MRCKFLGAIILTILTTFPLFFEKQANASETPPIGKYVCRQYMTTMGYLSLKNRDTYEVSKVIGKYSYDASTNQFDWKSGSYQKWGWEGKYEFVPAEGERPAEHVIRIVGENGKLKINCYYMADQN